MLFVQTTFAESSSSPAYSFGVLRESKYVSQGRDNLGDGGIYSFEAALEWRRLAAGAWFASGDSTSYEELNLYVDYGVELGPLYSYVGYTRLEFLQEDESDNEISAGVEISDAGYFIPRWTIPTRPGQMAGSWSFPSAPRSSCQTVGCCCAPT